LVITAVVTPVSNYWFLQIWVGWSAGARAGWEFFRQLVR